MSLLSATSNPSSYHTLISNVSGLFGLVVFLQRIWGPTSIEHAVVTASASGLATYLILAIGYAATRGVLAHGPDSHDESPSDESGTTSSEPSPDATDPAREQPQAV
jgi:hypothetical protein